MKLSKFYLAFAVILLVFSSCSVDDGVDQQLVDSSGVQFSSSIGGVVTSTKGTMAKTTKSKASWMANDAIGVFMKKGAGFNNIIDNGENVKYTTASGDGNFSWASPADKLVLPADGSAVDFVSYYPFDENVSVAAKLKNLDVSDQSDLNALSFLYSDNATGVNSSNANVNLRFQHQLSMLVFNIKSGDVDLNGLSVTVKGMHKKAEFDLSDKTFTKQAANIGDIQIKTDHATGAITATAKGIVIPNTNENRQIVFTVDGTSFVWDVPAITNYESGKRYNYSVSLTRGSQGGVLPEAVIEDWVDVNGDDIDLSFGGGVVGEGNQANPFTVSDALSLEAKTSVWVKGFVVDPSAVTGASSNYAFYLAGTAGESDLAKLLGVDLAASAVSDKLDVVADPSLVGKEVSLEGDFAMVSNMLVLSNVTDQKGGSEVIDGPGVSVTIIDEKFGNSPSVPKSTKINDYTEFDSSSPIVIKDAYSGNWADVRTTKGLLDSYNMHVWFPSYTSTMDKETSLLFEGIEAGYKQMVLTYEIASNASAANLAGTDLNKILVVKCNGVAIDMPVTVVGETNTFIPVEVKIPDGTTSIEFYSGAVNTHGLRLDNVKVTGVK